MTTEEKKKRLRYLQLKAKAGQAAPVEDTKRKPQSGSSGSFEAPFKDRVAGDPGQLTTFGVPKGVQEKVLGEGEQSIGLGLLSLPTRALGTLRTDPKTGKKYPLESPESNILRPEIEKVKGLFPASQQETSSPASQIHDIRGTKAPTTDVNKVARGLTELAGGIAGDPASFVSLPKKALEKPVSKSLKGLGKKIEASLLKPKETTLAKVKGPKGKELETLVDDLFKHDAGGTLKQSNKKIQDIFNNVETEIDNVISKYSSKNPGTTIDADALLERIKLRVNEAGAQGTGDDFFAGMRPEAQAKLEKWANELSVQSKNYGETGKITLAEAQKFKRLLNKTNKGFKKGPPSPETAPEETLIDIFYLELKDEIEKKVPAIKELNQVYVELLPAQKAVRDALSREGKKDIFGIVSSLVGLGSGAAVGSPGFGLEEILGTIAGYGAYKASRSGVTADLLQKAGKGVEKMTPYSVPPLSGISAAASKKLKDEEEKYKNLPGYLRRR